MSERPDPTEDVRRLYEDAEKRTAAAMEELVKRDAFGELLARATENVLAVTRIGNDVADLVQFVGHLVHLLVLGHGSALPGHVFWMTMFGNAIDLFRACSDNSAAARRAISR